MQGSGNQLDISLGGGEAHRRLDLEHWFQGVVSRPSVSGSPENLPGIQLLQPHLRATESNLGGWGTKACPNNVFNKLFR